MKGQAVLPEIDAHAGWLDPPESLALHEDEVHVWRASLEMTPSCVETLKEILSAHELRRAGRFYFRKDQDHFSVAHGLLRAILSRYLKREPKELRFCHGPFGKPALAGVRGGNALRFNMARSHGLALYAVTNEREIGIDLEYIRSDLYVGDIAGEFLSQQETDALNALPEHLRRKALFSFWTRKEACLKATGEGLSVPLKQLEVSLAPEVTGNLLTPHGKYREDVHWSLRDLDAGPGYAASVSVEGFDWRLKCWQWENKQAWI